MRTTRIVRAAALGLVAAAGPGVAPAVAAPAPLPVTGGWIGTVRDRQGDVLRELTFRVARTEGGGVTIRDLRTRLGEVCADQAGGDQFPVLTRVAIAKLAVSRTGAISGEQAESSATARVRSSRRITGTVVRESDGITCSSPSGTFTAEPRRHTHVVRDTAAAPQVRAAVGDQVLLKLQVCLGSCGYDWRVTRAPAGRVLKLVSSTVEEGDGATEQRRVLRYRVLRKGSTSIRAELFPPGTGRPAEGRLTVRVGVR